MAAPFADAHVHLQDKRLRAHRDCLSVEYSAAVQLVNGTCPADWEAVAALEAPPGGHYRKAYGVHPWEATARLPEDWEDRLRTLLGQGASSLGEIGLDRWIEPRDEDRQREVFGRQLELAAEYGLTPTIHCLRAWEELVRMVKAGPLPPQGFLVHGFGGSREVQRQLLDLGASFSFSAYALAPRRKRMRAAAHACPAERLLVETDAPDMVPDAEQFPEAVLQSGGERLHDPRAIRIAYRGLAELRGERLEALREQVWRNFQRLFPERSPKD